MIHVLAQIDLTPNSRESFLAEFNRIVPTVLSEIGCIEYGAAVDAVTDLERQFRKEDRVTIIEKWETVAHLKEHLVAPHMETYRQRVGDMIKDVQLSVLQPA